MCWRKISHDDGFRPKPDSGDRHSGGSITRTACPTVMRAYGARELIQRFNPLLEKVARIEWSRGGFGVELDAGDRERAMAEAFVCAVVQVDHRCFEFGWQRVAVDGVAMVVRRYEHIGMNYVFYRLIATAMAVLQLVGLRAAREREQLVA